MQFYSGPLMHFLSGVDSHLVLEARRIAAQQEKPGLHRGTDWWQLSDAEEEVFKIDRRSFPRMVMTWHCYEGFNAYRLRVKPAGACSKRICAICAL